MAADAAADKKDDKDWQDQFAKKSRKGARKSDADDKAKDDDAANKSDDDDNSDDDDKDSKWVAKGKAKKSARKSDKDDDDDANKSDDDDPDNDDDDDTNKARKSKAKKSMSGSDLDEETLTKSLGALSQFIQKHDTTSRKQSLLEKAQRTSLSKSESGELMGLLSGGAVSEGGEPPLADQLSKSLDSNTEVQNTIDVSSYVANLHDVLNKSLRQVGCAIEAADDRQQEFNLLSARTMAQTGALLKSLAERIGVIETQPARAPKSRGAVQPLNKSFAGQTPAEDAPLTKSQVMDALTEMNQLSYKENRHGLSKSMEDITRAVAKYEQTTSLSPALADEIRSHVNAQRGAR